MNPTLFGKCIIAIGAIAFKWKPCSLAAEQSIRELILFVLERPFHEDLLWARRDKLTTFLEHCRSALKAIVSELSIS
jgi:hypothetical protein